MIVHVEKILTGLKKKQFNKLMQQCMTSDVHALRRRWLAIDRASEGALNREAELVQLTERIQQSISKAEKRSSLMPSISYPADLPISQKRELIKETIVKNQVTILCGETGSGKTTQLPKICLEIGLGVRGKIGHTQPRRLAARAVSQRIADELKVELGKEVGFKVRFSDKTNENSYIKLMTDGILLAECNHDPYLSQYDTIIIDEAHERSLNIDFLIGYLKQLTEKRKDLKIIITSATIDPDRFAKHFDNAPVINVSGRTYPVEVRYRPYQSAEEESKKDLQQGIIDAVNELSRIDRGDILVFLSGERDIRETADALAKQTANRALDNTEVLPLLARLSNAEQNKIFHPGAKRRIILATNVAETSLTVPGIKYVIDTGLARISRYSWRSKIQRLPIEKISQASADQRKGRCGRVSEGVCIRLYDEEDFDQRAEFTEPEIQRTNLAAVILQMENQRLGHIDDFPFVDPPESRLINDGYRLLYELGAIDKKNKITKIGKHVSHFPIDPKLARMLLQAKNESALSEVLIIVSALATQDPRERPLDKQQAADEKHAVFSDKSSDFLFYLNLWQAYFSEKKTLSNNQLRKWCKKNYISWMRMREWIDTHNQIKKMLHDLKLKLNTSAASYEQIHRSLLVGLLANVGLKDDNKEYLGARSKRFNLFPGSSLFKSAPKWIMAAEIVETSKIYARSNAKLDVRWIESLAGHLLKYSYSNPHWEKKRSQVVALEQATLYGLIISANKKVAYEKIDMDEANEIFIRSALIEGDYDGRADFYKYNKRLLTELETQEAKSRRRDIIVDEEVLYAFYRDRLPRTIASGPALEKWVKKNPSDAEKLLLSLDDLIRDDATLVSGADFPDFLELDGARFPVEYHFDPTNHCDGVTLVTPIAGINAINAQRCEWLIPGLLQEKVAALIKTLPKQLRKNFIPAPDYSAACVEALAPSDEALTAAVAAHLKKMTGVQIPYDAWNLSQLAPHLSMNFRVLNGDGEVLAEGRNLQQIKEGLSGEIDRSSVVDDVPEDSYEYFREDVAADALDELGEAVDINKHGVLIKAYPALVRAGKKVNLSIVDNQDSADIETHLSLRLLIHTTLAEQFKDIRKALFKDQNLCLKYADFGNCEKLKQEILNKTIDDVFLTPRVSTYEEFQQRLAKGKENLYQRAEYWKSLIAEILNAYRDVKKKVKAAGLTQLDMAADVQQQLKNLFPENFITIIDQQWLLEYPRYLKAIEKRFEKSSSNATRDRQLRIEFAQLWDEYERRKQLLDDKHIDSPQLEQYRWMLEEYRVSLFAQELKTRFPVSAKRLKKYWNELSDV